MRACFAADGNLLDTVRGSAPDGGTGDRPLRDRQAILDEAFLYAVLGNCFAAADRLLDCGACIDCLEPTAWMPTKVNFLHFVAMRGDLAAVRYLLCNGSDGSREDDRYAGTPYGWATHNGQPEIAAVIRAAESHGASGGHSLHQPRAC